MDHDRSELRQEDRHLPLRVVLYDENVTLGLRIAGRLEDDSRLELIALCATLGDLNFVLNRAAVDVLLLHPDPQSAGLVVSVASRLAPDAQILVLLRSPIRSHCSTPGDLLVTGREVQFLSSGEEETLWALSPGIPSAHGTVKSTIALEAYRWIDHDKYLNEPSWCDTLA